MKRAFTLVEVLLVVLLTGFLMAAVVFCFDPINSSSSLDDGLTNIRTLTIYSRSTAMISGRKVKVEFPEGEPITVTAELDPINQPGQFTTIIEAEPFVESVNRSLVVFSQQGTSDEQPTPQLICYPDGSVELSTPLTAQSKNEQDSRRVDLKLPYATTLSPGLVD